MSKRYLALAGVLTIATLVGTVVAGQQPRLLNGRVTTQPAGSLAQTFRAAVNAQTDVAWIGYSVPVQDGERTMCCWSSGNGTTFISGSFSRGSQPCCGNCRIEPVPDAGAPPQPAAPASAPAGPVKLEGSDRMVVLFRIVDRQVERVRAFSEDCELDAGGRAVTWLQDVRPAESVALLESMIGADTGGQKNRISNAALSAIAMHGEPAAAATLERLARSHASASVRGEALFWIGNRSDPNAEQVILDVLEREESSSVRKRAIFALSQIKGDGGVPALIRTARTHQDTSVRSEAIFWLGQKAGRKAAGTITEAIEKDPETEVKKRAVFALSQLPRSEGVPLLIDVARKNSNPAVRKQAIFWLGQSKDPRAIEFFAEILR